MAHLLLSGILYFINQMVLTVSPNWFSLKWDFIVGNEECLFAVNHDVLSAVVPQDNTA